MTPEPAVIAPSRLSAPIRAILEQVEKRRQKIDDRVDTLEALIDAVARDDDDDDPSEPRPL